MSNFLYDLINNLSTGEKVYFKRSSKLHGEKKEKNYLKIYSIIEKMDSYNKGILSKHFEGTTIQKYLSSEIDYLKEKILMSLFNYNLNRSKRSQIQKGILMIEVLAKKGFRKEALKKLKFIKKVAYAQEEFTMILQLIELEEIILFKQGILGYKNKLKELRTQRNDVSDKIQNLNDYHILRQEIRELQFDTSLTGNDSKIFQAFINNELVRRSDFCLSTKAKENWYYINVLINYLNRDFQKGLTISADYIAFMDQNHQLFDINKTLPGISNYIYHAALTSNRNHYEIGMELLHAISKDKSISSHYYHFILHTRELEFSYYSKDNTLTEKLLSKVSIWLKTGATSLAETQIQYVYMLLVRAAIILKKDDIGIHLVNQWHQRGILNFRKVQARLFAIMIHYELNYLELIQSELVLLKKMAKHHPREKRLIKSIYSFLNAIKKYPKKKEFYIKKLQTELKAVSIESPRYYDFISFDYYAWSLTLT